MSANADLSRTLDELHQDRERLLAVVVRLAQADFDRARPGGWSIRRVIEHVIESEAAYAKVLAHLCGKASPQVPERDVSDARDTREKLDRTRTAVLTMADGLDAATLYEIKPVGREEYSPLSMLENIALHDREHAEQIESLLAGAGDGTPRAAPAGVNVRPATLGDLPRLAEIYNHYVRETPATFDLEPFTVDQRREWFGHYGTSGRHRLLVAERDDAVVGYTTSSRFHPRHAYDTTVEMTILSAPEAVGQRIGQLLYERIFEVLRGEDIHAAVALITLPNDASCALHERFGFRRAGVLREAGRKLDRYWDVAYYQKMM